MNRSLLIIISSDPATSHRPGEALRIAAGVATWQKARVTVCLRNGALALIQPDSQSNSREIERLLSMLATEDDPILLCNPSPSSSTPPMVPCRPVDSVNLAARAAQADCVLQY